MRRQEVQTHGASGSLTGPIGRLDHSSPIGRAHLGPGRPAGAIGQTPYRRPSLEGEPDRGDIVAAQDEAAIVGHVEQVDVQLRRRDPGEDSRG